MALTPEEKATLESLTEKANQPDEPDEYVEIWDETGAGAKVKRASAKTWLQRFGIDLDEITGEEETENPKSEKRTGGRRAAPIQTDNVTHAAKYFGNKNQAS